MIKTIGDSVKHVSQKRITYRTERRDNKVTKDDHVEEETAAFIIRDDECLY